MPKKTLQLLLLCLFIFPAHIRAQNTPSTYLMQVLENMEKIKSASYTLIGEAWKHGDTTALFINKGFFREQDNPSDTTIGAKFIALDYENRNMLSHAYDGQVRIIVYHDHKGVMIDDFTHRPLPFRPVSPPFINNTKNIIRYALHTTDRHQLSLEDQGDHYYFHLVIQEDRQVEFFGRAHHMPLSPYIHGETTSEYELWISKSTDLPYKLRRTQFHDISVANCLDLVIDDPLSPELDVWAYVPKEYEFRKYGAAPQNPQQNPLLGKTAPEWMLQDFNGQTLALQDLQSQILLINFTGIGCGPCQASIPFLRELADRFPSEDFDLVAIESWAPKPQSHSNYVNRNQINYLFLMADEQVLQQYQTGRAAPIFFILDHERTIRHVFRGFHPETSPSIILQAIESLM